MREIFCTGSIHFRQFRALWFLWQKSPPPPRWGNFFTLDLSISGNFEQLWFLWQKSPPSKMREIFYTGYIHFRQFWATLVFVAEKPPLQDEGIFFTLDLSISGNLKQLWFLWQKSPPAPEDEGNIFLHWIYQFQVIMSNFGFCGRKAPPENVGKFFTLDLSISGNFKQLWFLWQKSPPTPKIRDFFYTGSIHFRQFWATLDFVTQKPPPPQNEGIFLHWIYPFQAISSNFGFCGRKALPPPKMREILYTGYIHFRQFWATLVFVAEKPPLQDEGFFLHWIYPFQAISSNFSFCGRKAPPPPKMREIFFYTGSIHFR